MLWTYNIDKADELLNKFNLLAQHFMDLVIHNEEQFSLIQHESDQLSDYLQIHSYMTFLRLLCNNSNEFKDYLRVQHNRISGTNIISVVANLIRVFVDFTKFEVALRVLIDAFDLIYALVNQNIQENKELFISTEICKHIHKIMNLGWFLDNDIYCTFNGISLNEERYPFISNKLILELKLKALQVSNQIYDDKYKYEFLVAIGKEILDKNLKMGYGYLMNINKGIMHSMLFNKNSEINQDFNIQMLFE